MIILKCYAWGVSLFMILYYDGRVIRSLVKSVIATTLVLIGCFVNAMVFILIVSGKFPWNI